MVLLALLLAPLAGVCGDAPALTEYQVKALFLLNFSKYVEWPASAFEQTNSPITIGVVGESHFGADLEKAVEGKSFNGRKIIILPLQNEADWGKCRILFISVSEKKRQAEILSKVGTLPVLTVGENDQFIQQGGMIVFALKDGKVRLEVNLDKVRQSNLEMSSKLLSVADVVRGKNQD